MLNIYQNPEWRTRLKKDPGIPNLFPFKDKILAEIEEKKRLKAEDAVKRREAARARNSATAGQSEDELPQEDLLEEDGQEEDAVDEMDEDDSSNPMAALLASAQARAADFEDGSYSDDDDEMDEDGDENGVLRSQLSTTSYPTTSLLHVESSRRAFDKIFKQVLEASDVILYVLDARDPQGTRSQEVERQIMASASGSKRLILILNKIDLIPPPILKGWLVHLRRYFPTLPLRASSAASNAQTFNHRSLTSQQTSSTLLKALKTYSHSAHLSRATTVGITGYPNVGKSSVLNALTSRLNKGNASSACPVGSEAGITTSLREVKLDSKLKLLDSPGIVFPNANKDSPSEIDHLARLTLLSALPPKQIADPIPAVSLLLTRLSSQNPALFSALLTHYSVPALLPNSPEEGLAGDVTTDFLIQVARKRGRLGKGGVPNLNAAAMTVISDWRDGRIKGWVRPPKIDVAETLSEGGSMEGAGGDRKEIVKEWGKEFKLEGLWGDGPEGDDEAMVE